MKRPIRITFRRPTRSANRPSGSDNPYMPTTCTPTASEIIVSICPAWAIGSGVSARTTRDQDVLLARRWDVIARIETP